MTTRALFVINTLPPDDLSGAGEQVAQLASALELQGVEVRLLGRTPGPLGRRKLLFPLLAVPRALSEVRRWRPDVVQIHESDGGLVALALRILRRWLPRHRLWALLQVSYVEEFRAVRPLTDGPDGEPLARPVARELAFRWLRAPGQIVLGWLSARLADRVLVPSAQTGREVERDYGAARWSVLPNVTGGIDPGPQVPCPVRPPFFLYVGRFRIRKGIEVLLAAVARIAPQTPDFRLILLGDGERHRSVVEEIQRRGLEGVVRAPGSASRAEVAAHLRAAGALVVPSTYEGMPLVILEAMERSVPTIASRVSGIPEVIEEGVSGWLVEPENVHSLASTLLEAWRAPEERKRRGRASAKRLEERYRPSRAADVWRALLDRDENER